jgi:integrase/recombinase XerD
MMTFTELASAPSDPPEPFTGRLRLAVASWDRGPILLNTRGARMDRHAATRRLRHLAEAAGLQVARAHPHLRHDQFRRRR